MNVVVYEDHLVERLGPNVTVRPACDLMIGATTLAEWLGHFGPVRRGLRPHLARHLAALAGGRDALWGGPSALPPPSRPASSHGAVVLVVNARVAPSRENMTVLRGLVEAGHRAAVHDGTALAAALLHLSADGTNADAAAVESVLADPAAGAGAVEELALPRADAALEMLALPHDLLSAHERAIAGALAARIDSGRFRELRPGLFAAAGATIADLAVVRSGPVVVERDVEIGPFVCLDGPIWIGAGARVHPHTWIRAATAIGTGCRVGGEVEAAVLEPFANKPHDGFLGHSHVGSWVNLAAGTATGNLKATYGPVRLHTPAAHGGRTTIHTGRQFLGALLGELVRTSVNAALPCGARIGVAATVGGTVADLVDPFVNTVVSGGERTTVDQAAVILERMMARRGWPPHEADRALLAAVAAGQHAP